MTHRRHPGTVEDILHKLVGTLSPHDIKEAIGVTLDVMRKASQPEHMRQLWLREAIGLDAFLISIGRKPELLLYHQESLTASVGEYQTTPKAMPDRLTDIVREIGALAGAIHDARDPKGEARGDYSEAERLGMLKQMYEVKSRLGEAIRDLEARKPDDQGNVQAIKS